MTREGKFKFLSLFICFLLLISSNVYAMATPTSNKIEKESSKIEKELKKLETKYGVTIDFTEQSSIKTKDTKDKIQLKDIKELEELLADINKSKENKKVIEINLPMQTPSINSITVPEYDPLIGHYVSKDYAPYDGRLAGSLFHWEYIEFDYALNSNGSIKNISWITSYTTGLSAASWEHKSGWFNFATTNFYRDTAMINASGVFHLNFGIGSGGGIISWGDTFTCNFISPFRTI